jgi:hypothetical protein
MLLGTQRELSMVLSARDRNLQREIAARFSGLSVDNCSVNSLPPPPTR